MGLRPIGWPRIRPHMARILIIIGAGGVCVDTTEPELVVSGVPGSRCSPRSDLRKAD